MVAGIVAGHGAHEVVKVKSLTTDEIGLNDALAARGVEALETDFAELILQLDGDWSSHILVPAIHRNRTEIRDLFRRTIGPDDLSDDPADAGRGGAHLPARAVPARPRRRQRRQLRDRRDRHPGAWSSRRATAACARRCRTVLISVVGIEKLLPRFEHLAVFMQLLPRSSTGERMNPYTSLWTGVTPGDGPRRGARRPARQRAQRRARATRSGARRCTASAARPA